MNDSKLPASISTLRQGEVHQSKRTLQVLKILQCTNLGGMEQIAYRLLRELTASGWSFRLASPRPLGEGAKLIEDICPDPASFRYRGRFGWRDLPSYRRYIQSVATEVDAIWLTGTCAASLAAIRGSEPRKLLSHHYHHFEGVGSRLRWSSFYHLLCRQLDAITYPTDFTRNEALSIAPWLREKSHVVRYGHPIRYHSEEERLSLRRAAREHLGLPEDAFVVGNAGWLVRRKRFDVFLQTAARVVERVPQAVFVICGGGELEAKLKAQVHSLGLGQRVRFQGWVKNLAPHYQSWDVCLFNSDFDTLPCTPIEASTHGCPVVASLIYGGLNELIDHQETGILLDRHNVQALAAYVVSLARSPSRVAELRSAVAETIRTKFSQEKCLEFHRQLLT
jgi:glycosyltransferase involved in cell wall biosynthesis